MSKKNCKRKNILINKFKFDWDELNISFKSLIIVGIILFIVIILIAIFSDGGQGTKNTIEVVFRSTLASVFGFLLSSNIRFNKNKNKMKIKEIKDELNKIEKKLDDLDVNLEQKEEQEQCYLEEYYNDDSLNLVQIAIALGISIISISVLSALLITNNLENVPSISQIRDLMCSSIGFLIGESKNK